MGSVGKDITHLPFFGLLLSNGFQKLNSYCDTQDLCVRLSYPLNALLLVPVLQSVETVEILVALPACRVVV